MRKRSGPLDPVTIAFAKEHCTGVQVHCMRCQQMTIVSCDLFQDEELVPDLPKRRRFRCTRCGGARVETRPNYPSKDHRAYWLGLTPGPKKPES